MASLFSQVKKTRPAQFFGDAVSWITRWTTRLRPRRLVPCRRCGRDLLHAPRYREMRTCDYCGYNFPLSARARIHALADPDTFVELTPARRAIRPTRKFFIRPDYRATRQREAIVVGAAEIAGQPVVLAVFDFRIFGGSMSMAVGEAMARAFELAARQQLPLVAIIASGGVRIQEGMPALLQMAKTIIATQEFQRAQRPFIAVLTNPTTGGVYASFANLADILLAEPGALIGFAGPRVVQVVTGSKLPSNSHNAESAYQNGMLDAIVGREELREVIGKLLRLASPLSPSLPLPPLLTRSSGSGEGGGGWGVGGDVRPPASAYLHRVFSDFVELHGDRLLGDDPTILGGLARFENQAVVVIAQERKRGQAKERGAGPAGYHKAERLIRLAGRLNLPIVTFVDTPGADPSFESERYGIAGAIAHCLAALLQVPTPTISVITGDGTSGGALALAATDRVLMLEYATYAVISPEGASAILYGDASHAPEIASTMEMKTEDLLPRGIIDRVVHEPEGGAPSDVDAAAATVKAELEASLAELQAQTDDERLATRRKRYRNAGL